MIGVLRWVFAGIWLLYFVVIYLPMAILGFVAGLIAIPFRSGFRGAVGMAEYPDLSAARFAGIDLGEGEQSANEAEDDNDEPPPRGWVVLDALPERTQPRRRKRRR